MTDHHSAALFHLETSDQYATASLTVEEGPDDGDSTAQVALASLYATQGIHHALLAQVHLDLIGRTPAARRDDTPPEGHP